MHKKLGLFLLLSFSLIGFAHAAAKADSYALDTEHSTVQFKIRHLVSKVTGSFTNFVGKVDYDASKPSSLKISGKIDASTINTGVQKRDDHLRSGDFFDTNNPKKPEYKWITFESGKFTDINTTGDETTGRLAGKITIHGVTKDITLNVIIHGKPMLDPWGSERLTISALGVLNRKDFGLNWNAAIETGGVVVGDEVELILETESTRKPAAKPAEKAKAAEKTS